MMRNEQCKHCSTVMHGDWLACIDGEFCNNDCHESWCSGQFKLNRGLINSPDLREQVESLKAANEALRSELEEAQRVANVESQNYRTLRAEKAELVERLQLEREQYQEIRAYTRDGKIACICLDHEIAIRDMLAKHQTKGVDDAE